MCCRMRKLLTAFMLSAALIGTAHSAAAQVSFDLRIGPPPPPRAYVVPARPGPGYAWVEGYWYPRGSRYTWRNGYWAKPPYQGAYWVNPYYAKGRYYGGYWDRGRGRSDYRNSRSNGSRNDRGRRR
jgi:hypothetical protein